MQNICDLFSKHLCALCSRLQSNFKLWSLFSETALKPLQKYGKMELKRFLAYSLGQWNCAREYRRFWENQFESYHKELWHNTKWKTHMPQLTCRWRSEEDITFQLERSESESWRKGVYIVGRWRKMIFHVEWKAQYLFHEFIFNSVKLILKLKKNSFCQNNRTHKNLQKMVFLWWPRPCVALWLCSSPV